MKIGLGQFAPRFDDKNYNLKQIEKIVSSASVDLWVFPEMSVTGYMVNNRKELLDLSEEISSSPSIEKLQEVARINKTVLLVGLPEKIGREIFNTVVVVGPDGLITKNQKSHLFLKEKLYFSSGQIGPTMFNLGKTKIGLGICYDYMFPEFWRALALDGADLFCCPANFVFRYGFDLMRVRSIENGVASICVNRVGEERGQNFFGESQAVDCRGNIVYRAGGEEEFKVVEIDPALSRDKKWNPYNDLILDRRPEIY
ncbi:MAG: nitrilase-related carbon-nitrogen hydrolase [Candidatus Uhrbacteria bacterium]